MLPGLSTMDSKKKNEMGGEASFSIRYKSDDPLRKMLMLISTVMNSTSLEGLFPPGTQKWWHWNKSWDNYLAIWGSSYHLKNRQKGIMVLTRMLYPDYQKEIGLLLPNGGRKEIYLKPRMCLIPLKEKTKQKQPISFSSCIFLLLHSQHFWHQTCESFPPPSNPLKYQLGVLQFNSTQFSQEIVSDPTG